MLKFTALACAIAICLSGQLASSAQGQELLRWQFEVGDHFKLTHQTANSNYTEEFDSLDSSDSAIYFDWLVTEVDNEGNGTIVYTIERCTFSRTEPSGETIEFDTENPTELEGRDAEEAAFISTLPGVSFEVDMSPLGEILAIRLSEESIEVFAQMEEGFEPEMMRYLLDTGWILLPEAEVKEGESWQADVMLPRLQWQFDIETQLTFEGIEEREGQQIAVIDVEHTLSQQESEEDDIHDVGAELHAQECDSHVLFDIEQGYLVECSTQVDHVYRWITESNTPEEASTKASWALSPAAAE